MNHQTREEKIGYLKESGHIQQVGDEKDNQKIMWPIVQMRSLKISEIREDVT